MRNFAFAVCALALPLHAAAQSFNVDFGSAGSQPAAAYGAKGLAGFWNVVGPLPDYSRIPLTDVAGAPSSVNLYMAGGDALLEYDHPGTSGEDAALLDDMLIGDNNPVDVCVWFENVPPGDYEVVLYGLTPNDPSHQNRLRVDHASPGPTMCGGEWVGFHQEGVTFVRFRVLNTSGYVGLHSGLWAALIQSGLNGIQLVADPPTDAQPHRGAGLVRVYPNPSRGEQSIEYSLESGGRAERMEIFDAAGRLVRRLPVASAAGFHRALWDGRDAAGQPVPAAVYFVRPGAGANTPGPARIVRR